MKIKTLIPNSGPRSFAVKRLAKWSSILGLAGLLTNFPAQGQQISADAQEEIKALLNEKATWTPAQRKMTSHLVRAAKAHRGEAYAVGAKSLRAEKAIDLVSTEIEAVVTPDLLEKIEGVGGQVLNSAPQFNSVRALIPVGELETVAGFDAVKTVRPAEEPQANSASVISEGDITHRANFVRNTFGAFGAG